MPSLFGCLRLRPARIAEWLVIAILSRGLPGAVAASALKTIRKLVAQGAGARCDLPRLDASSLTWSDFKKSGLRGSLGVVLTGLFSRKELARWNASGVLSRHGNQSMNADNTRGAYSFPTLHDYIDRQDAGKMIFLSHSLLGVFGEAFRSATKPPRLALLRDFAERPILSVGVEGSMVPKHPQHPETWHALLQGSKAWWLAPPGASFGALEDPCGYLDVGKAGLPNNAHFCVVRAGEVLYFGEGVEHSVCSLERFVLGVGAQGHTEDWPPLLRAANRGDLAAARKLGKKAAGGELDAMLLETAGSYGHTALHRAALHGHAPLVEHLLSVRARPDLRDAEGLPPILLAAFSGHVDVVELLAARGEGVEAKDPKGAGALQWASTQGHLALAELLVSRLGVDPGARDSLGGGSISAAATMGHRAVVRYLHERGAEVEDVDSEGMRPLHWAALHGHAEVVESLLAARAEAGARDRQGRTPLDLAGGQGRAEVAEMLLLAKARGKRRRRRHRRGTASAAEL